MDKGEYKAVRNAFVNEGTVKIIIGSIVPSPLKNGLVNIFFVVRISVI